MISFNSIFNPTKEEKLKRYQKLLELHESNIGNCSTCIYYKQSEKQGFITDCGQCDMGENIFAKKVCSNKNIECNSYEENILYYQTIRLLINQLEEKDER